MSIQSFLKKSQEKAHNLNHRKIMNTNIGKYDLNVITAKQQFQNISIAKEKAHQIKKQSILLLDQYLEQFERKAIENNIKVLWANTKEDALNHIDVICKNKQCSLVVKSKSMVSEEIGLNKHLEKKHIEVVETDLGEYIQQLAGETPYHILTPAIHKSKEDIAKLFSEKLHVDPHLSPEELTQVARNILRDKYAAAQIGITGANFLIADIGGIALTENEGNIRLCTSLPRTHIAIVGIEKMIPSIHDIELFWALLASHGSGVDITSYNSIITGPKKPHETDGPDEMYVILLNNKRVNIIANERGRSALYCIRCGACLNICPIYKNIGGHAYETTYTGPIGKVISPQLNNKLDHLSFASSLCGSCTEVCPVKIPLHELILFNRQDSIHRSTNKKDKWLWWAWKKIMLKRSRLDKNYFFIKPLLFSIALRQWSKNRIPLHLPSKSFTKQWKKKQK